MNSYRVRRRNFPLTVYRIDYPGAQTTYSQQWGFQSAGNFTPYHVNGLRNAVTYHLDWQCRTPSPFISVFGNRQHAENWAQLWNDRNSGTCYIVTITIQAEDDVIVFRVANLINRLGVTTSLHPSQYHSEYFCFRRIPAEAIVRREPVYQLGMKSQHVTRESFVTERAHFSGNDRIR